MKLHLPDHRQLDKMSDTHSSAFTPHLSRGYGHAQKGKRRAVSFVGELSAELTVIVTFCNDWQSIQGYDQCVRRKFIDMICEVNPLFIIYETKLNEYAVQSRRNEEVVHFCVDH